jgi:hypothetical protein
MWYIMCHMLMHMRPVGVHLCAMSGVVEEEHISRLAGCHQLTQAVLQHNRQQAAAAVTCGQLFAREIVSRDTEEMLINPRMHMHGLHLVHALCCAVLRAKAIG